MLLVNWLKSDPIVNVTYLQFWEANEGFFDLQNLDKGHVLPSTMYSWEIHLCVWHLCLMLVVIARSGLDGCCKVRKQRVWYPIFSNKSESFLMPIKPCYLYSKELASLFLCLKYLWRSDNFSAVYYEFDTPYIKISWRTLDNI